MAFLSLWPTKFLLDPTFLYITVHFGQNYFRQTKKFHKSLKTLENEKNKTDLKELTLIRRDSMEFIFHFYCF
jgi:hypothetical protein